MRAVFLNRFFHPDHSATSQILTDLAVKLALDGHDIKVIASRSRYDAPDARLPAVDQLGGIEIRRVWTSRFGRFRLLGRSVDYVTFYLSAAWCLLWTARRGDVVVVKTDPPLLSVVAAPIVWLRGAHLVNWLQDLYPEVAQELGFGRGRLAGIAFKLLRAARNWSLRCAAANVVLGEQMRRRLLGFGIDPARIRIAANWADGSDKPLARFAPNRIREDWGAQGKFVIAYSGNLGRAHDIATMQAAMESTVGEARILWVFVGGGALYQELQRHVATRGLGNVQFHPYQPRERLDESLAAADVHLVCLQPELEGLIVPSKIYGILAAARPAIFIGALDGEVARILASGDCGETVLPGDGPGLARLVVQLAADPARCAAMGHRARALSDRSLRKTPALAHWAGLLQAVCSRSGR